MVSVISQSARARRNVIPALISAYQYLIVAICPTHARSSSILQAPQLGYLNNSRLWRNACTVLLFQTVYCKIIFKRYTYIKDERFSEHFLEVSPGKRDVYLATFSFIIQTHL